MHTNENTNILVVGGAGYIGSHMVLQLKEAGYTPIVFDNLSKGHRSAVKDVEFVLGDLADKEKLSQVFKQYQINAVMHFASFIDVAESVQKPWLYYENNVATIINLLEVMRAHKVEKIIFSSTAAVYGNPQTTYINENHSLLPINPYGHSKLMAEQIIQDYAQTNAIQFAILRYFNAAGADPAGRAGEKHHPETHLIPLLLQVANDEKQFINIYGDDYATDDGSCMRDYVHVMDICRAHLLALQKIENKKLNLILNLGNGKGYSVKQVVEAVQRVTRQTIATKIVDRREGDPAELVADNSLAKKVLGWEPLYSDLDTIIQHAWQYVQKKSLETLTFS